VEAFLNRVLVTWVDGARRRYRAVLWITAVLTLAVLAYATTHIGVNTHHTAILSDDMPFWQEYHEFAAVFPILDEALLVVIDAETSGSAREGAMELAEALEQSPELYQNIYVPGGDAFFQRNALLYLSEDDLADLSDQLATVQPLLAEINRDRSLTHMAGVLTSGIERLRTHPDTPVDFTMVFDSWSRAVKAVLEGQPKPISWTELILRRKLPGDSARRVVVLHPVFDYSRILPGKRVIDHVRETAVDLGLTPANGVRVRVTGNVALGTEEMLGLVRGAALAIGGSLVVVALVLAVALRRTHLVMAALITLLVSLVWTAGFAAAVVGHVNVVSVTFAILIIGLGIDFGIHFCMRYAELVRAGQQHPAALEEVVRSVGGSLVLCAGTTAMGFFVFIPTDFKAVGELGMIAGTGMIVSLFATLTVLPALLSVWRDREAGEAWQGALWFERVVITASSHHARAVRVTALALAMVAVLLLPGVRFDHHVGHMRDPSVESVQTFNELLEDSDASPWTMDLMAPDLESAVASAERLRELDVVESAVTLADYVPTGQAEKLEILGELGYFVPEPPAEDPVVPEVPLELQISTLEVLQQAMQAPWLAEGDPARATSAARAARYLGRFLARLEAIEGKRRKQEELATFERSLTGALPEQMRSLWEALDPDEVTLESLPSSLSRRMLSPDGRARIEILPSGDLDDNEQHAHFVDGVRSVAPAATGSAVTILEFGRAVVKSFRQALASAVLAHAAGDRAAHPGDPAHHGDGGRSRHLLQLREHHRAPAAVGNRCRQRYPSGAPPSSDDRDARSTGSPGAGAARNQHGPGRALQRPHHHGELRQHGLCRPRRLRDAGSAASDRCRVHAAGQPRGAAGHDRESRWRRGRVGGHGCSGGGALDSRHGRDGAARSSTRLRTPGVLRRCVQLLRRCCALAGGARPRQSPLLRRAAGGDGRDAEAPPPADSARHRHDGLRGCL
jgi:hopanoid biosynthesis associated RND transporter like protein HpnN